MVRSLKLLKASCVILKARRICVFLPPGSEGARALPLARTGHCAARHRIAARASPSPRHAIRRVPGDVKTPARPFLLRRFDSLTIVTLSLTRCYVTRDSRRISRLYRHRGVYGPTVLRPTAVSTTSVDHTRCTTTWLYQKAHTGTSVIRYSIRRVISSG